MIDLYLLYGPPGVGKGTIAERIPAEHCLGVGCILRARRIGLDGKLISDAYVNQLIQDEISLRKQYVVLDGYPRTLEQVDFLKALPETRLVRVYALTCPDTVLMNRLSLRQTCLCGATYHPTLKPSAQEGKCDLCGKELFRRSDDSPEIVRRRLQQFHEETEPVLARLGSLVRYVDSERNFKTSVLSVVDEILSEQGHISSCDYRRQISNPRVHD